MQTEENARIVMNILEENRSPNRQARLVSTPAVKTQRKLKINNNKEAANHNGVSINTVKGETTTMKTPVKLIVKDVDKAVSNHTGATAGVVEGDISEKPIADAPPQKTNQLKKMQEEDITSEPETKKRKKGRPTRRSNSERLKILIPVQQKTSSRSTKRIPRSLGKINYNDDDPLSYLEEEPLFDLKRKVTNITKTKVPSAGVIAEPSHPTLSTHEVQAKTNVPKQAKTNVPKVNETPATNNTLSPPKKPANLTPGTARKRVGGEGRTASMQKVLLELPNLCDPNVFSDILHKTYGGRFEASKVFENLTTSDLKQAILKKFTALDLLTMIQSVNDLKQAIVKMFPPLELMEMIELTTDLKQVILNKFTASELMAMSELSGGVVGGQFLTEATVEALLRELQSREELKNSDKFLNAALQNIPNKLSKETKKALNSSKIVEWVLDVAPVDAIVKKVGDRADLKSCDKLLTVLLQNSPGELSDETKKSVLKFLIEKFQTSELVDVSHEALKMHIHKNQKN